MQVLLRPYRNKQVEALAAAVQTAICVLFLGYSYIYVFERFEALPVERGVVVWVMTFASPDAVATAMVVVVAVLATLALGVTVRDALAATSASVFLLCETRRPPELSMHGGQRFHLFLSHTWNTGQDQCAAIKRQLQLHLPGIKVFLDVDDLRDIGALEEHVEESMAVVVFLSRGYFASRNCLREVEAITSQRKPVILVLEADEAKGGLTIEQAMLECPEKYRDYLFKHSDGQPRLPYRWHRVREFQMRSLCLIASEMLGVSPSYARYCKRRPDGRTAAVEEAAAPGASEGQPSPRALLSKPRLELCLASDVAFEEIGYFGRPPELYASPHNPGAERMAKELIAAFEASERPRLRMAPLLVRDGGDDDDDGSADAQRIVRPPDFMVLYLNGETWLGESGASLAREVAAANKAGLRIVLLHENDELRGGCPFARFFQTTPGALIDGGLYSDIAVAMHAVPFREVSLLGAAQAIGATRQLSQTTRASVMRILRSLRLTIRRVPHRGQRVAPPNLSAERSGAEQVLQHGP